MRLRKRNVFRHSYISYRLAEKPDVPGVALEAGNSPAMIFQHYRELVTPDEAKAWFGITPDQPAAPKPAAEQPAQTETAPVTEPATAPICELNAA